jgi:hypothetical protein
MGRVASFVTPAVFTRRNRCRCVLTGKYASPWVRSGGFEATHKNLLPLQEFDPLIFRRRGCSIANLVLCFGYEAGECSLHCHQNARVSGSHTVGFKGPLSPNSRLNSSLFLLSLEEVQRNSSCRMATSVRLYRHVSTLPHISARTFTKSGIYAVGVRHRLVSGNSNAAETWNCGV